MTSSRTRDSLGPVAVMLAVGAAVLLLFARFAHAGVAAADPTPALTGAIDTSLEVWTKDGPLWLAIAVAYVALREFLGHQHWLQQGRLLSVLTAVAGVGAAAIAWRFTGAPVGGIVTALVAGVALVQHPAKAPGGAS